MRKIDHESKQTRKSYPKDLSGTLLVLKFTFLTNTYRAATLGRLGEREYGDRWLRAKIPMHVMVDQCGKNRIGVDLGSSRRLCIPASPLSFHCVDLGLIAAVK